VKTACTNHSLEVGSRFQWLYTFKRVMVHNSVYGPIDNYTKYQTICPDPETC
jgi:hypothetical protein